MVRMKNFNIKNMSVLLPKSLSFEFSLVLIADTTFFFPVYWSTTYV